MHGCTSQKKKKEEIATGHLIKVMILSCDVGQGDGLKAEVEGAGYGRKRSETEPRAAFAF